MIMQNKNFFNNIKSITNCTGCGACFNICPVNAIYMQYNEEGFYSPSVDESICINCGKCAKICPSIKFDFKNKKPICYSVAASDEERANSTSGGFFSIIANYILEKNGYVCGVSWNKDFEAEHIIIDKKEDLYKLRFSKYVQAKTGNCFSKIKELLENDNFVLFSGTPCQVAGLINYLSKDYEKLLTLDLICHGAPSPKVWQDYLEENFDKNNITNVNFRKKDNGWERCNESWYYGNCSGIDTIDGTQTPIGVFFEAFIKNRISNEPCLDCKYRTIPRPADFTCGDFWYLYHKKMNDNKGLSLCLLNNKKAIKIFDELKSKFKFYRKINLHNNYNKIELNITSRANKEREIFFKKYKEKKISTTKLLNAAIGKHYDIGFLSFFNGLNYGSALVAYAANSILEELGQSVLNIHKRITYYYDYKHRHMSFNFAQKNYFISREYQSKEKPIELNQVCDSFVLGSDTLWWWSDVSNTDNYYWLDFVNAHKRKIAFCTSFGFNEPNIPLQKQDEIKYLYSRFDSLSTRDKAGVDILKNYFNSDSEYLCDPVFIADKSIFDKLAGESKRIDENYIVAYVLDADEKIEEQIREFGKKHNLSVIFIPQMHKSYKQEKILKKDINIPIEDFVYLIKNANFVITDSFHGACFSAIFERQFVAIVNKNRGNARYEIFNEMSLNDNFISSFDLLSDYPIDKQINFIKSKEIMKIKRDKALQWLKEALKKPHTFDKMDLLYDHFYSIKAKDEMRDEFLKNAWKIKLLYYKYRLFSNCTLGKTRKRYKEKRRLYKTMLKENLQ